MLTLATTQLTNNINSNKIITISVTSGHYKLYVRICERIGLNPVPQEKCTIQLIQAIKLVADSYYGTNIKPTNNTNQSTK